MQEQFIPIDIHTNKLTDWLVSRRHGLLDWQPQARIIREKINNAIQDMPAHEGIVRLLAGTHINYFHCLKIVDILRETEKDSRNVFGLYGSQRMKDWQEIVRLYEKDNIGLSEASQILVRNVQYEVPLLRKQIAKCQQNQSEYERKEIDYNKQAHKWQNDFNASCKQLGIKGENIKKELLERCSELPKIHEKLSKEVSQLASATEYYIAFVKFMLGDNRPPQDTVPLLSFIIKNGNTTTYEWIHKEKPLRVEENVIEITAEETNVAADSDTIDFGDSNGIDFGDSSGIDFGDSSGIDFGDDTPLETGEIDWGDGGDLAGGDLAEDCAKKFNIVIKESGTEGGVARGDEALSLLDNPVTRAELLNNILEVESFLKLRLFEMLSAGSDLLSLSQMQNAEPLLQFQTDKTVEAMLSTVQKVNASLNDSVLRHLHTIRHNPRYVDSLTAKLKQKLDSIEKFNALQVVVREKCVQEGQEIEKLQPKLQVLIEKTRELQSQIEAEISKKYKGRPVNLMGGINVL